MPVTENDVIRPSLGREAIAKAVEISLGVVGGIVDRGNLHERDPLERFQDVLLGEIAEMMVIDWLHTSGKYAVSAVDKDSAHPDPGHDIQIMRSGGALKQASVKSSVSGLKSSIGDILDTFTIATTPRELRDVNIQVYFWLSLYSSPRVSVPSLSNAAIIAWASRGDLETVIFHPYQGESRLSPKLRLRSFRPMRELLDCLE